MSTSRIVDLGKRAAVTSGILGALCVLGQLCFLFPHLLVVEEARAFYAEHFALFRGLLLVTIAATFVLACVAILILRSKAHGVIGLALAAVALVMGGGTAAPAMTTQPLAMAAGLDYFILSLLVLGLLFVPMERLWPLRDQKIFRRGWQTDLTHFFANHVGIQLVSFATIVPVQLFFAWAVHHEVQQAITRQPIWIQFLEILIVVDLVSYWVHRAFHRVPLLWRFHAIHHSVEEMDWLAGSRLHIVDVVVTRLFGFLPVFLLGFSAPAVYAYVIFISFHAVYIHANVTHRWPYLRRIVTTPEFHHWHHTADKEGIDKNFAVLVPALDSLFGTAHRPDRWPASYGTPDESVPRTWSGQLVYPFRRRISRR